MPVATLDTLKYAKALRAVGVPEAEAEAHSAALAEVVAMQFSSLVTKDDLRSAIDVLRQEMVNEFKGQRQDTNNEFRSLRQEIASEFKSVRHEMIEMEQRVSRRMDVLEERMKHMQWMVGAMLFGTLTMMAKMFLFKAPF